MPQGDNFPQRDNLRDLVIALIVAGVACAALWLWPRAAHAIPVEDVTTEGNTMGTWRGVEALGKTAIAIDGHSSNIDTYTDSINTHAGNIEATSKQAADSLTTPGGSGAFVSLAQYFGTNSNLWLSGVHDENSFANSFPGWEVLPADAVPVAQNMVQTALDTYSAAVQSGQNQLQHLGSEDTHLQDIENCNASQSLTMLQAMQCNTEAVLAVGQREQMNGMLLAGILTVEAVRAAEELQERASAQRTVAASLSRAARQQQ